MHMQMHNYPKPSLVMIVALDVRKIPNFNLVYHM